MINWYM